MPKKTRTARFSRTISSSERRPTRAPILVFRTVVILSHHQLADSRKAVALAWLDGQSKQRSVGWVGGECAHRDRIRHVETVVLENHSGTGLSCVVFTTCNSPNLPALHLVPQSETASIKS